MENNCQSVRKIEPKARQMAASTTKKRTLAFPDFIAHRSLRRSKVGCCNLQPYFSRFNLRELLLVFRFLSASDGLRQRVDCKGQNLVQLGANGRLRSALRGRTESTITDNIDKGVFHYYTIRRDETTVSVLYSILGCITYCCHTLSMSACPFSFSVLYTCSKTAA